MLTERAVHSFLLKHTHNSVFPEVGYTTITTFKLWWTQHLIKQYALIDIKKLALLFSTDIHMHRKKKKTIWLSCHSI